MTPNRKALLIVLISMMLSLSFSARYQGCIQLQPYEDPDAKYQPCRSCYKRLVNTNTQLCESVVQHSQHCNVYTLDKATNQNTCDECIPGFYLQETASGRPSCVPIPSKDKLCVTGVTFKGKIFCGECQGAYLVGNPSKCVPFSQTKNADPHCLWGTTDHRCARCVNGYSVNVQTGRCVAWGGKTVGCQTSSGDGKYCLICNPYAGYSITGNQACLKNL